MDTTFSLNGYYKIAPPLDVSGDFEVFTRIEESIVLSDRNVVRMKLEANGAIAVPLGTLAGANVVVISNVSNPIVVTLTSDAGSAQTITVGDLLVIISPTDDPYTAISVTRETGVETTLNVCLGEI